MIGKRIEYIDALRGFTMFLVVYSHIWTYGYHVDERNGFVNVLTNFFLIVFFFISGYLAYKPNSKWSFGSVCKLLKSKFVQLMIPSVVFFILLCNYFQYGMKTLPLLFGGEYWFTSNLFLFFIFYYLTKLLIRKVSGGVNASLLLLIIAFGVFCLSFSHTLIERTQFGSDLFHYSGMKNWRYYFFFILGVVTRMNKDSLKRYIDNTYVMAVFIVLFFLLVFFNSKITFTLWQPIGMIVYGVISIVVLFGFFRKYERSNLMSGFFGKNLKYIGQRTMDVYMIHYFLLPLNLNFLGAFFVNNVNPSIEFLCTTMITLLVIGLSLIIGNVIRISTTLAHYLLGAKH